MELEEQKDSRLRSLEQQVTQLSNAYSTFSDIVNLDPKLIVDGIYAKKFKVIARNEQEIKEAKVVPGTIEMMLRKIDHGKEIQRHKVMFAPTPKMSSD